jgi:hypothetical protein
MGSGVADRPDPAHALLVSFGRLVRQPRARSVFVPLWSAYPAVGFGDRDALPTLRSVARRSGWERAVTWPAAGLHGLRELNRLEAAAAKGRDGLTGTDRRSRLPNALEALLRAPALTPKVLAARLSIAPHLRVPRPNAAARWRSGS